MHSKKFYIVFGVFYSAAVSLFLCCFLPILQGVPHIDPVFFALCFAIAFVTSFVIMAVLPITRIADWCAECFCAQPGTAAHRVISGVFVSTMLTFFLGLVMTAFITGVGTTEAMNAMTGEMIPVNLFDRYVALCIQFWPTIVVVALLCDPVANWIAGKIVRE